MGRGGPRDIQLRQQMRYAESLRAASLPAETGIHPRMVGDKPIEAVNEIDMSQYMPLAEVKQKIEEAVSVAKKEEQARYESGLNSLNKQLNELKKKYNATQEEIINKDAEIKRLKAQVSEKSVIPESIKNDLQNKDNEISNLKSLRSSMADEIEALKKDVNKANNLLKDKETNYRKVQDELKKDISNKEVTIAKLSTELKTKEAIYQQSSEDLQKLQERIDKLYTKISDGSIQPLVGTKLDRPELEDKIFIDPLDSNSGAELDSHINIDNEEDKFEGSNRNIGNDLVKLRKILKL